MEAVQLSGAPFAQGRGVRGTSAQDPPSLEAYLATKGRLSPQDMMRVTTLHHHQGTDIEDILRGLGLASDADIAKAHAERLQDPFIDLTHDPPNAAYVTRFGVQNCLTKGLIPLGHYAGETIVVTARPNTFDAHRAELEAAFGPIRRAFAPAGDITACICDIGKPQLAHAAERRVKGEESCRTLDYVRLRLWGIAVACTVLAAFAFAPVVTFNVLFVWAVFTLMCMMVLRTTAAAFQLFGTAQCDTASQPADPAPLPKISLLVPLHREAPVIKSLIGRLRKLDYPKQLLEVLLIVEDTDPHTRASLAQCALPPWARVVSVPAGGVQTKPRAMNYALDHCNGAIIGIYDAEDAPEPDQLQKIAARFAHAPLDVACLQGVLDFYNPRANWLSRCFTIEYATWFRVILPGLARMGLPIPLGGTTLFFRRDILDRLGGWDAHNVTEDADLGIRLARHGYHTELIPTTTYEEANCRPWPWVRQRSRWLKGYAVTWTVHMRRPARLWRDLGPWQFFGVQVLFIGTLSQFVMAPLLWSLWAIVFGVSHPLLSVFPTTTVTVIAGLFAFSEVLNIAVTLTACRALHHRHLIKWVLSLYAYFPLGTIACYKGLWELFYSPFFWDKTAHGVSGAEGTPDINVTHILNHASAASQKPSTDAISQLHTQILRRAGK